jgi:hypothetical protein
VPTSPTISSLANPAKMVDKQRFSRTVVDDLLMLWIINATIPFSVTSDHWFQALLQYHNDKDQIPLSPSTTKQHIVNRFRLLQPLTADLMQPVVTHLCHCGAGWTSHYQTMTVLGIIVHFTSHAGRRMNPVIGLHLLEGSHIGAKMAGIVD